MSAYFIALCHKTLTQHIGRSAPSLRQLGLLPAHRAVAAENGYEDLQNNPAINVAAISVT